MDNLYKKFFPENITLETPRVILRPMTMDDYETLLPLTNSEETWKYFTRNLQLPGELKGWMEEALSERANGTRVPFIIIDRDTKQIAGCTSYGNISFFDKRIEIGWTWLGPAYAGMGVNNQAKFALLSYAFDVMKMERVEVKTDVLNERAKAALLKVGMVPEGVLRSHMVMHSDRRRSTMYFSIIREEWQERRESFFPELL